MNNSCDLLLLRIIGQEIFKDGGATFIHFLPNYNPQVSTLLKKCNTKLVPFLQKFPRVFQIIENDGKFNCHGHDVVKLLDCSDSLPDGICILDHHDSILTPGNCSHVCSNLLEKKLADRTFYELRKRHVKLLKRLGEKSKNESSNVLNKEEYSRNDNYCPCIPGAQLQWLTNKVKTELHEYIRSLPTRPKGVLPFSHQWFYDAMVLYLSCLEHKVNTCIEDDTCLLQIEEEEVKGNRKENIGNIRVHLKTSKNTTTTKNKHLQSLETVAGRIKYILENYGPAVGGMDLGRLMSDRTLRQLTNGEDARTMIWENPHLFKGIRVFRDIRRTKKGTVNNNDNHSWYIEFIRTELDNVDVDDVNGAEKRFLAADEVGSFSLTKRRVATGMANLLLRACIHGSLGFTKKTDNKVEHTINGIGRSDKDIALERGAICIDLTAGVGGNTIAFGKVYSRVYAFEIDPARAVLLQRNIDRFMDICDKEKIIVQCQDSVKGITNLARELCANNTTPYQTRISVFIDPPFGGVHYRSKNVIDGTTLCLGENMPLVRVVTIVCSLFKLTTFGLKLPLTFDVRSLVQQLNTDSSHLSNSMYVKVLLIKKIERQLFIILESELQLKKMR
mmetsp:Transcript_3826/g.7334  ORF Transcript_3826/g.7334 Transcript_3826/m.7334 type:complete len:615 (+) Transcript_3826:153-1997(+)